MSQDSLQADWAQVPEDPDLVDDLGYLLLDLDVISTSSEENRVIILPKDESLLREDAFIVAHDSAIVDLADRI